MGFYSTLIFYRPASLELVTGQILANFIEKFFALGLSRYSGRQGVLQIKFGKFVDQDMRPSSWIAPTNTPRVGIIKEIDWDIDQYNEPLIELPKKLYPLQQPIYRAYMSLGGAMQDELAILHRTGSPQNDEDYVPDSWSLQIGPIETGKDGDFTVGWIAVGLGGNGYLFPWTLPELVERAETIAGIQSLMKLCRETWSVDASTPSASIRSGRIELGNYWPYETFDLPMDWYWGLQGLL